jgi:ABC-type transport system involved in multi-copper enzyme maturation permease subunit
MFRQLRASFRGRKFFAAAILVSLAPVLAASIRNPDPVPLTRVILDLHFAFLLPVLAVSLGSGLLHEEAEEGTLTYLFTAPVAKSSVVLGKWAGALACGWVLALASLGATFLLSAADLAPLGGFVRYSFLAAALGLPAYLGMFTFLGTLFRRGYIAGLIYCFGFELALWVIPGAAKRLSLGFYIRSLVEPFVKDKTGFEGYFDSFPADAAPICAAVLAGTALLCIAATLLVVPRKEFRARNVQG